MRGIGSMLFRPMPVTPDFKTGLIVLSCSEDYAVLIVEYLKKKYPRTTWTLLYRYDPSGVFAGERVIYSSDAFSVGKKIAMLTDIRRRAFDVVYIAATDEISFGMLKVFGFLSHFEYFGMITENLENILIHAGNRGRVWKHFAMRWRVHKVFRTVLTGILSWLLLFPLGLLYIIGRTCYLVLVKIFTSPK
jgi:hypothetical protein